jgi:hypothetical protein
MHKEIWKDIKGYEGLYQVSNLGRVKSLGNGGVNQFQGNEVIKLLNTSSGYAMVNLSKNGLKKIYTVHSLVANSFLIKIKNLNNVNHIDENKLNNNVTNLEWVSVRENRTYSINKSKTSSSYVGVYFKKGRKTNVWGSCISIKGKSKHLGYYSSEIKAYQAYLSALEKYNLNNKYA